VSEPLTEPEVKRAFTTIGFYRGTIVAIKELNKKNVDLTRSILKELIQVNKAIF
jgi:guanylate cyclase, other